VFQRVGFHEFGEFFKRDVRSATGLVVVGSRLFQRMFGPKPIADVGIAPLEVDVFGDEVVVHRVVFDDVVGDVVQDHQIGLRRKDHRDIGQVETAMLECREDGDFHMGVAEPPVGHARPQNRVHFGHVRAPQDESIGMFEIVVTAHRLVDAEGSNETGNGRGHAMARIGIDVVRTKTGLVELGRRITFPNRPLTRAEHANTVGTFLLERGLPFLGHHIEGFVPRDRLEVTVLGVDAIAFAQ